MAGKTPFGLSYLRIVWGQDFEATKMITCGAWRLRYPFYRDLDGTKIIETGIPRFYVEELVPRETLMADDRWQKARYVQDEETGQTIDVLGPCPEKGFYETVFQIAKHDMYCCDGREVRNHTPCLGLFREPREIDIDRIARMIQRRNQASRSEADGTSQWYGKQRQGEITDAQQKRHEELKTRMYEYLKPHQHRFTTFDPSVIANGKFHFLSAHNRSGSPTGKATK